MSQNWHWNYWVECPCFSLQVWKRNGHPLTYHRCYCKYNWLDISSSLCYHLACLHSQGHEDRFTIYVHASREQPVHTSSLFIGRNIRSQKVPKHFPHITFFKVCAVAIAFPLRIRHDVIVLQNFWCQDRCRSFEGCKKGLLDKKYSCSIKKNYHSDILILNICPSFGFYVSNIWLMMFIVLCNACQYVDQWNPRLFVGFRGMWVFPD